MSRVTLLLVGACLVCLAPRGTPHPEKQPKPANRTDAHGDPLPAEATARLGTARLRHGGYAVPAALSPDGKLLATVVGRESVCLWDVSTGREVRRFPADRIGVQLLAFSPDGRLLVTGGFSGVQLWDAATGKSLRQFEARLDRSAGLAFSRDGSVLALGTERFGNPKNTASIWDTATGKQLGSFPAIQTERVDVALSPDGKTLATWGQHREKREAGQTVQLWDVAAGKELRQIKHESGWGVSNTVFSPSGETLAVCSGYGISLHETATGKERRRLAGRQRIGHALVFSPDGKRLIAATPTGAVQIWDTASGKRLGTYEGPNCHLGSVIVVPDGRLLAWGYDNQAPCIWEVVTGKMLTPRAGHSGNVATLAFSANGKTLYSAGSDGIAIAWDAAAGKETRRMELKSDDLYGRRSYSASIFALSPDGKYLATGQDHGSMLRLLEMPRGLEVCAFPYSARYRGRTGLTFSPRGTALAAPERDRAITLRDTASGKALRQITLPDAGSLEEIGGVAISPDDRTVAVAWRSLGRGRGGWASDARVWDIGSGKELYRLPNIEGVSAVAYSSAGTVLATVESGAIRFWDAVTGKLIRPCTGLSGQPSGPAAFSPDGRLLATATYRHKAEESSVLVWEVASGTVRHEFKGHQGAVLAAAFSPDGRTLATGGGDTSILFWDLGGRTGDVAGKLTGAELDELWSELAAPDAKDAWKAMCRLRGAPRETVDLLRKNLPAVVDRPPTAEQISALIRQLDADDLPAREKATRELAQLGKAAETALRKARDRKLSPEVRRRLDQLVENLEAPTPTTEWIRPLRGVEVLERIGTPEAKTVLQALSKGKTGAPLTIGAMEALKRLAMPKSTP